MSKWKSRSLLKRYRLDHRFRCETASAVIIKSAVLDEWSDDYTVVTSDEVEVKDSTEIMYR